MKGITLIRPSSSMAVAMVALFVALGGVGYAAATIDSGDIVNNSVRGKDIKNKTIASRDVKKNGLGGVAIKESRLGKVPSAESADSASTSATASNADRLDGVDSSGFMAKKTRIFEKRVTTEVNAQTGMVVGSLTSIPAGTYLVTARLEYDNDGGAPAWGENETCTLGLPGDNDEVEINLAADNSPGQHELVTLQKMVSSASTFSAHVSCTGDGDDDADKISIIAVALD